MDYVDYYKVLNLEKNASAGDIKSAFRKLARTYHPDLNASDKEANKKFQQINEAHEVLSDPEKRKKYDTYGSNWKNAEEYEKARQAQGSRQNAYSEYNFGGQNEDGFSDFFSSMFGQSGKKSRQGKFKGQDYNAELQLSLREVYTTRQQTLAISGKNIRITIPAGVENGQVIKLKGHGAPGTNGGPDGDLFITFVVEDDPTLKRTGNDLHTTVEIDLYTAVLGGDINLDTLSGKIKLKVNPETQTGTKIRLKGKGFPIYKSEGQFGDLYVTYHVKIPTNLTERQKELFAELSKL